MMADERRVPWDDGTEYREMHGVVAGYVGPFADVQPAPGVCPRGRMWCDTDRQGCRSFGGVINIAEVREGKTARILCAEAPDADPRLTEWAQAKADR